MLAWFQSLTIGYKLMVIGLHILGIVAVIAWVRFIEGRFIQKRYDSEKLSVGMLSSLNEVNEGIENCRDATSRHYEAKNQQKEKERPIVRPHLLCQCIHKLTTNWLQQQSDKDGDNSKYPALRGQTKNLRGFGTIPTFSQSRHIRTIVNWLRRRVNQSGEEPIV
jgi:hypothetical protein